MHHIAFYMHVGSGQHKMTPAKHRQFLQAWLCQPRNCLCAGKHEVRYDSGDVQELTLRHEAVLWPELPPNPAWPAAGVGALPEARLDCSRACTLL